jgi:hypothetical protein
MLNPAGFAARESTVPYGLAVATAQKWAMLTFCGLFCMCRYSADS